MCFCYQGHVLVCVNTLSDPCAVSHHNVNGYEFHNLWRKGPKGPKGHES